MARRRKTSFLDDLLNIAIKIPLWANLIIAGVTFATLRFFGGEEFPVMKTFDAGHLADTLAIHFATIAAHIGQFIIPPIFILGGVIGWIQRKARARRFNKIGSAPLTGQSIRNLSWEQFEQMVGEAFCRRGYSVSETAKGADGGIDLVMHKGGELFLVQCKQWKALKVSVQVVRELYGVMSARGAAGGFVVTSGNFTADAVRFAKGTSMELIDGSALAQMFKASPSGQIVAHETIALPVPQSPLDSPASAADALNVPNTPISIYDAAKLVTCPRCTGVMTPRFGKGQNGGIKDRVFFGCTSFPKCRGTRRIDELPRHVTVESNLQI
ncbi:restriction endonuclease [Pseudomonas aeruginosa]|uniref:restriction endonuclease n=1 Tax=Pseudomonas aeruginosa TaxID=287 RepID=UPI002B279E29|nr:restriction endonuclease [Pseudomonas aeruginosa]MEA8592970.1 restriction endonuclease [Pseudomonas aeruginosa]